MDLHWPEVDAHCSGKMSELKWQCSRSDWWSRSFSLWCTVKRDKWLCLIWWNWCAASTLLFLQHKHTSIISQWQTHYPQSVCERRTMIRSLTHISWALTHLMYAQAEWCQPEFFALLLLCVGFLLRLLLNSICHSVEESETSAGLMKSRVYMTKRGTRAHVNTFIGVEPSKGVCTDSGGGQLGVIIYISGVIYCTYCTVCLYSPMLL